MPRVIESRKRRARLPAKEAYNVALGREESRWGRFKLWYRYYFQGFVLDATPGFPQVISKKLLPGFITSYDTYRLQYTSLGVFPIFNWELTVWATRQHHVYSCLMAAVAIGIGALWRINEDYQAVAVLIQAFAGGLVTLSSFVISGFVTFVVNRWYQRRLYYIALLGNLKALLILAETFIAAPPTEREVSLHDEEDTRATSQRLLQAAADARRTVARYTVLVFELAMLKQRGHIDTEIGRQWLSDEGLLVEETASQVDRAAPTLAPPAQTARAQRPSEWDLMVPGARHLTVLAWISTIFRKCLHMGLIPDGALPELCHLIERARSNSSDMMDRTIYDLPYVYCHMVTILVKLTVISNSCYFGTLLVYDDHDSEKRAVYERPGMVALLIIFVIFLNCGFQGLLDLQPNLQNPFGFQANDIPHERLSNTLRELAASLANNANKFDVTLKGTWTEQPAYEEALTDFKKKKLFPMSLYSSSWESSRMHEEEQNTGTNPLRSDKP